jgi:hypothetical protein
MYCLLSKISLAYFDEEESQFEKPYYKYLEIQNVVRNLNH